MPRWFNCRVKIRSILIKIKWLFFHRSIIVIGHLVWIIYSHSIYVIWYWIISRQHCIAIIVETNRCPIVWKNTGKMPRWGITGIWNSIGSRNIHILDILTYFSLPIDITVTIIIRNSPACDLCGSPFALNTNISLSQRQSIYLFVFIHANDKIHLLPIEYGSKNITLSVPSTKPHTPRILLQWSNSIFCPQVAVTWFLIGKSTTHCSSNNTPNIKCPILTY